MTKFKINERGYWESTDNTGHAYDAYLNQSIINLLKKENIKTLVDFGCGMADYVKNFTKNGLMCEAYDGNPNTPELTSGIGSVLDLSKSINLNKKFDCVMSLEVGEHIPKEYEEIFIDNLCSHTNKMIILSWAVVGQNGDGHFNCQNNDYVIDKMKEKGFDIDWVESNNLRNRTIWPWFRNTIMIFNKI